MTRLLQANPLSILVIEDNYGDFLLLKENLCLARTPITEIHLAETLVAAIDHLRHSSPDIIFLDLYLPDSNGIESFNQLKEHIGGATVIILSGLSDTKIALEAITLGAQDYLAKGEFDDKLLGKTIVYSMERKRNTEKLREANERYSLVTKATHDLIWDWNLMTGEVFSDGTAVKEAHGLFTNTAIHDIDNWSKRIHPDDSNRWFKAIEKIKNSDEDFFELEYRVLNNNRGYRNIYDRGYVVRDSRGKALRLIGAAQDITEKLKLESALRESQLQRQRAITEATIKGQENEREQLGLELHDNINQILATARLYLDFAISETPIRKDIILRSKGYISQAIEEIRRMSKALLPPPVEEFGLITAICELCEAIGIAGNLNIQKSWEGFHEQILPRDQKLTIYRIIQEQLNNIIKHACAKNITITLGMPEKEDDIIVELQIKDDGKGFDPALRRNGVGLRNIISRSELFGGTATIQSQPGQGCELKIVFPGKDLE